MYFVLAVIIFAVTNLARPIIFIGLGMGFGWFIELVTGSFIVDAVNMLSGGNIDMVHLSGLLGLLTWVISVATLPAKKGGGEK